MIGQPDSVKAVQLTVWWRLCLSQKASALFAEITFRLWSAQEPHCFEASIQRLKDFDSKLALPASTLLTCLKRWIDLARRGFSSLAWYMDRATGGTGHCLSVQDGRRANIGTDESLLWGIGIASFWWGAKLEQPRSQELPGFRCAFVGFDDLQICSMAEDLLSKGLWPEPSDAWLSLIDYGTATRRSHEPSGSNLVQYDYKVSDSSNGIPSELP